MTGGAVPPVPAATRCCAGFSARVRLNALLTSATWVKACGKLPTSRPTRGSYSSLSNPTSLRKVSNRSNSARHPPAVLQDVGVGQPEAAGEERALARRQPVLRFRCRSA